VVKSAFARWAALLLVGLLDQTNVAVAPRNTKHAK
jgi:hypothetical protein